MSGFIWICLELSGFVWVCGPTAHFACSQCARRGTHFIHSDNLTAALFHRKLLRELQLVQSTCLRSVAWGVREICEICAGAMQRPRGSPGGAERCQHEYVDFCGRVREKICDSGERHGLHVFCGFPGPTPPPQTFFAFPGLKWSLISDPAKRRLVPLRGTRVWETTPPAASLPGSGHPIVAIPQNQAQCIQSNVLGNPFELSKV